MNPVLVLKAPVQKSLQISSKMAKETDFLQSASRAMLEYLQNIHTPVRGILPPSNCRPPSFCCCHSRPCVPVGILSCPQQHYQGHYTPANHPHKPPQK